jgi:hypothetical protein
MVQFFGVSMLRVSKFFQVAVSSLIVLAGSVVASAEPKDDVKAALQKLVDSPNYSWTTTVEGGFGAGTTEGKTQADGLTSLSLNLRNTPYEVVLKGDKAVVKTDEGWKSAAELTADAGGGGTPNPARFVAMMTQTYKTPAAQALSVIDKLPAVQKTDDGYAADLSADDVKALIAMRGRRGGAPPVVSDAKGTMKAWIKDGNVTKFQSHLTGKINIGGTDRDLDRTTTTEIKDVGSTKIEIPDEAKAKLEAAAAAPTTKP